jgi:A/G-specific adenine glycosylase
MEAGGSRSASIGRQRRFVATLRADLLAWYDAAARALPWRTAPADRARGERPDPYRVWLSEIMLQQTTAAHAHGYFLKFISRWPTLADLAAAPPEAVMAAWAGLGYYARARNLTACARAVEAAHGGVFPASEAALRALPGIGAYSAAAIAAIAFDQPATVVDANVERVIARLYAVETPLPEAKGELRAIAASLAAGERPGDWAQALMDLGALVCRSAAPDCGACPLARHCRARAGGAPAAYPRRVARAARPHRHGAAFVITRAGEVALRRRPAEGLLGGMLGLPTTAWCSDPWTDEEMSAAAPMAANWTRAGVVDHVFTHFALSLAVWRGEAAARDPAFYWLPSERALKEIPTVFAKALRAALAPLPQGEKDWLTPSRRGPWRAGRRWG